MICAPCRDAGAWLAAGYTDDSYPAELHGRCRGGTWCDCQHLTRTVVPLPGQARA